MQFSPASFAPAARQRSTQARPDTAALWARFAGAREPLARAALIEAYGGFARIMAAKAYARRVYEELEFGDYLQYAMVGLIEAIDRFDPGMGHKFETFAAPRITGAVLSGVEKASEIQQQIGARRRLLAQRLDSLQDGAPDPAHDGAAKAVFARLAELAIGLAVGFALEHSGMHRAGDAEYADNSYHGVELKQLRARVQALVTELPENQRTVIYSHYLQQVGFDEIALGLGVSRSRVAQLHKEALGTLRTRLRQKGEVDLRC